MNTNDIPDDLLPDRAGDILEMLVAAQTRLEERYRAIEAEQGFFPEIKLGDAPLDLNLPVVQWFFKDASQRVIEEMCEGTNVLKNKQWKRTHSVVDQQHFIEEVFGDAVHFLIRMAIYVYGPDEAANGIFEAYFKKHAVNDFRVDSNY